MKVELRHIDWGQLRNVDLEHISKGRPDVAETWDYKIVVIFQVSRDIVTVRVDTDTRLQEDLYARQQSRKDFPDMQDPRESHRL